MKFKATPIYSLLTGGVTVIGMTIGEIVNKSVEASTLLSNIVFASSGIIFFFIPVLVFVVGIENLSARPTDFFTKKYWITFRQVGLRMLLWFVGAAIVGSSFGLLNSIMEKI